MLALLATLVLQTAHEPEMVTLRLRVLDHRGDPLVLKGSKVERRTSPRFPRVICSPSDGEGRALAPTLLPSGSYTVREPGEVDLRLLPGQPYLVGYVSLDIQLTVLEVTVDSATEVELRLPAPVAPGELSVEVQYPNGRPRQGHALFVADLDTGLILDSANGGLMKEPTAFLLPPGRYEVRASERARGRMCGNSSVEGTVPEVAPNSKEVEVVSNVESSTEIGLRHRGRIRLTVQLPEIHEPPKWEEIWGAIGNEEWEAATSAAVRARELQLPGFDQLLYEPVRRRVHGFPVRIESRAGDEVLDLYFYPSGEEHHAFPWAIPGEPCWSTTPIPVGPWTLIATLEDGRELRRDIEVKRGSIQVELAPS